MFAWVSRSISRLAFVACILGIAAPGLSQAIKGAVDHPDSRIDIYGGYGYLHPINSGIDGHQYVDITSPNATVSITGFFNHYVGIQMEGGYFSGPCTVPASCGYHGESIYTAEAGPELRFPLGPIVPFIHALGGGERTSGPSLQTLKWGWGVTGGGGFDIVLPFFNHHLAIRPIQADFQYSQVVYGPLVLPAGVHGGFGEIDALKLSGGFVYRMGEKTSKEPVMLGCSIEPGVAHPGDIVTITGSTLGLNAKRKTIYTWSSNGGRITPAGPTATVDTTGLTPGDYTVTGRVEQGSGASQQASCVSAFTIKPFAPPSVSCIATPNYATSGTTIAISTIGTSQQNRPLTYSYTTTEGQITSNGPTASLSTAGLDPGPITVTCNAVDDFGQSASNTTQIMITRPPAAVIPQTQPLCSLSFARDRNRPVRVDNESKACLDDIALALNNQAGAKLVIIGNASPDENPEAAAERTLNVRQYLVQEKGIDPARIELRVGETSGRSVSNTLVPPGAVFNQTDTETFNEKAIQRHGEAYGTSRGYAEHRLHKRTASASKSAASTSKAPTNMNMTPPNPATANPAPAGVAPANPKAAPKPWY